MFYTKFELRSVEPFSLVQLIFPRAYNRRLLLKADTTLVKSACCVLSVVKKNPRLRNRNTKIVIQNALDAINRIKNYSNYKGVGLTSRWNGARISGTSKIRLRSKIRGMTVRVVPLGFWPLSFWRSAYVFVPIALHAVRVHAFPTGIRAHLAWCWVQQISYL